MFTTLRKTGKALPFRFRVCLPLGRLLLFMSLNRPFLWYQLQRQLRLALPRDLCGNLSFISLLIGCFTNWLNGGIRHPLLSFKLGKMLGHVGYPNRTSLQPSLWNFQCVDYRNPWVKQSSSCLQRMRHFHRHWVGEVSILSTPTYPIGQQRMHYCLELFIARLFVNS